MSSSPALSLVLDTNVVLDWLVFRDPSCLQLGQAIERGEVRWLVASEMHDEWQSVLRRGVGASRLPDFSELEQIWHRYAVMLDAPAVPAAQAGRRCRCTDPDDQKFIELALQSGASWLLSRDRAVLKVAREASRFGLQILAPTRWSLPAR